MPRTPRLVGAAVAAVGSVAVLASPASAWTGGSVTGASTSVTLAPHTTCTSSTLTGSLTPAGDLTINAGSFSGCPYALTKLSTTPIYGTLTGGTSSLTIYLSLSSTATCKYGGIISGTYSAPPAPITVTFAGTLNPIGTYPPCLAPISFSATYTFTGPGI